MKEFNSKSSLDLLVLQARFQSEVLGLCETVASLVNARHDTIAKVGQKNQKSFLRFVILR